MKIIHVSARNSSVTNDFNINSEKVNGGAGERALECGIKEKILTWTEPNQWMVVKDINGDTIMDSGGIGKSSIYYQPNN